jgi:hypothetical protein
MFYTIFRTTNKKNGKIYIGKHQTDNINDTYIGSGTALIAAIKKWGRDSFVKEILFIYDNENQMNEKERELVNENFVSRKDTYNKGIGGEGGPHFKGKKHSPEVRQLLREKRKKQIITEEARSKISESNSLRIISEETRKKISEKAKSRFKNMMEEEKQKFSNSIKKGMNK